MLPPTLSLALTVPLALASPVRSARVQDPVAQAAPSALTRVDFHVSPAVDLYFYTRTVAVGGGKTSLAGFEPAVAAAKKLDQELGGSFLAWGPLEGLLPSCTTAADFAKAFAQAPETFALRAGTSVQLRARALELAAALVQAEPGFAEPWKKREARIAAARARWDADVGPKERALYEFHLKSLGMTELGLAIPVFLVAEAPPPGAVTHRDNNGDGVCFVAVDGAPGSQLYECILHETTHALDVATQNESALGELRRRLEHAGIDQKDRAYRDLPHTLMFVQAAESIRRIIDPAHQDYGEVAKYYQRAGPSSDVVRGFWHDYLDGKITRAAALDGIVASVKK